MSLYSSLRQVLAPYAAKLNGLLTGWDGTEYNTPGEAVRSQISALHVLIGDEPGTAIDASAIGYNDSNVADELTGLNGRLEKRKAEIDAICGHALSTQNVTHTGYARYYFWNVETGSAVLSQIPDTNWYAYTEPISVLPGEIYRVSGMQGASHKVRIWVITDENYNIISMAEDYFSIAPYEIVTETFVVPASGKYLLITSRVTGDNVPHDDVKKYVSSAEMLEELYGLYENIESGYYTVTADDLFFTLGAITEGGRYFVGAEGSVDSKTRASTKTSLVYSLGGEISCSEDYRFRVLYYTSNEIHATLSGGIPDPSFVKIGPWVSGDSYTVESGYYVLIFASYSESSTVIEDPNEFGKNFNIAIKTSSKSAYDDGEAEITTYKTGFSYGIYSAGHGGYEANTKRVRKNGFLPAYVDELIVDAPYALRILAWDFDNNFIGILRTSGNFEKGTGYLLSDAFIDVRELRKTHPNYRFKIYVLNDSNDAIETVAKHIYFKNNLNSKALDDNAKFNGLTVAIIGDSISTNGASGIDSNVPEITVQAEDVGNQLSAYLTYYDVQAGLSLGGHTFDNSEIGTEVTFTPTADDVGKSIGLPNNYNDNSVTTWWEIMQEELGVQCIPNTWSGSSITSHEASTETRKCSYAWHESQIRKCGIRVPGTMQRVAPDVIIVYRGTNDFSHSPYTLLTNDYFDNANWNYPETDVVTGGYGFKEGMCLTIKKIRDTYPNAKIFLCTMNVFKRINYSHFPTNNGINTLPQYNNAIREIADFMGCGIIDFDKDGITFENCYAQGYITDSATIPTHPNDKGHRVMGLKAIADLKAQFSNMS